MNLPRLTFKPHIAPHKCRKRQQKEENGGNCDRFFQAFCGVLSGTIIPWTLHTGSGSGILLQRGIAIFDCEAAALPGRFLPELGRSSERPFFLRRSFGPWRRCSSLMGIKPTSLLAPGHGPKSLAQKSPPRNPRAKRDRYHRAPAQRPKSLRQNC